MMVRVRPMVGGDKPAVIHILRHTPEFKPAEVVVAEEIIDSYLQDTMGSGYHVMVAEAGSVVVGYICFGPTPLTTGTWDVYWLAVAPEEKGRGIGKTLLAFTEGKIKEEQGRLILIETSSKPGYERTIQFYHLKGYDVVCRIADFYEPGDDMLVFHKRLG